jgi:hypothetical protein
MHSDPEQQDSQQETGGDHPHEHHLPGTNAHANGTTNGQAGMAGTSMFELHAPLLRRNGYSPVPIEPGEKRPLGAIGDWNRLRATPLTDDDIARVGKMYPYAGVGVVGGYRGLVPIDIDTEDQEIRAAIDRVLPDYLVAKRGRRGFTVFYRDPKGLIRPRKFKKADGSMIMELLTTGQVVIPPTLHPETQRPYQWVTEYTLLQVHIDELPELY